MNAATIAKIQAVISVLLSLLSATGVNTTQIQKWLGIAVQLLQVEAGLLPPTSITSDIADIDALATALSAAGVLPTVEQEFVTKYVGEFDNLVTEYQQGQPIIAGRLVIGGVGGTVFALPDGSTSQVAIDLGLATDPTTGN